MRDSEVEHLADVGGGLAEKRGDHAVGAHDRQGPAELGRDHFGGERLAATGRTAQEHPVVGAQAVRLQDLLAVVLVKKRLDERPVGRRQHDVVQPPGGFAHLQQRQAPLAVFGDGGRQLAHDW